MRTYDVKDVPKLNTLLCGCGKLERTRYYVRGWYGKLERTRYSVRGWCGKLERTRYYVRGWYGKLERTRYYVRGWCGKLERTRYYVRGWYGKLAHTLLRQRLVWQIGAHARGGGKASKMYDITATWETI
jgi:hypothetical protein